MKPSARNLGATILLGALIAVVTNAPPVLASARPKPVLDAGALEQALAKLRTLGSVLFIAAHPDDENTALLAYLSKEKGYRTGYLALTRGDGGQNLIGTERGNALGVIRTQELLAARALDGAEQYFSRAVDFGYSKSPEETLEIWGRERILSDVVRVIRQFRPDVILTRFPSDGRGGHGHHTASAILAEEAFVAAADPTRFPEQLEKLTPWQTKRLLWNAWRPQIEDRDPSLPVLLSVDLGTYSPLLGASYTELSGRSRSMHKSQGFGSSERRGSSLNYFELTAGEPAETGLFDGVDVGWSRLARGQIIDGILREAQESFDPTRPQAILPLLLKAYAELENLESQPWVEVKRSELVEVIRSCAGIWVEAIAATAAASPGDEIEVTASIINRSDFPVMLEGIELSHGARARDDAAELHDRSLAFNQTVSGTAVIALPADLAYSQPYWLEGQLKKGYFDVADASLIGLAENRPALSARFSVRVAQTSLEFESPVFYRWTERVAGERYRYFEIVPPVTVRFDREVYIFPGSDAKVIRLIARSALREIEGDIRLQLPDGWSSEPASHPVRLAAGGAETAVEFLVRPGGGTGSMTAEVVSGGRSYGLTRSEIDYPHIPAQTLMPRAGARVARVDLKRAGREIGYVMGSGDLIPEALTDVGYRVTLLSDEDLEGGDLAEFDAIVVGIRAYNTRPRLRRHQDRLLEYVHDGGNLVVQYNTLSRQHEDPRGPYPFSLSRDRVTVEEAEVRILIGNHALLNRPNRIEESDFDGWIQERGLYFPNQWDERYEAVLSSNDPGESPKDGGLLFTRYGEGTYIYTGYSWFRELPAGVPGAYRLFVNLVSGGKE